MEHFAERHQPLKIHINASGEVKKYMPVTSRDQAMPYPV
jgi:hypothetical protein